MSRLFSAQDLDAIESRGLTPVDLERQLSYYRRPPKHARLLRPCRPGDGIRRLSDQQCAAYGASYEGAGSSLSVVKFVPASGAASRMFRSLSALLGREDISRRPALLERAEAGDADAGECLRFLDNLESFAFYPQLQDAVERFEPSCAVSAAELARSDAFRELLRVFLDAPGLAYASLPKALLAFHSYPEGPRTAFEEHLVEAACYGVGRTGERGLHFTVSPEHEGLLRELLDNAGPFYEDRFGVRYRVEFSAQRPSTDSVAVDTNGELFRDDDGALLFRPGGHGALLANLGEIDADLIFIKNIDNVCVESFAGDTFKWKKALAGLALELRDRAFDLRRKLEAGNRDASLLADCVEFVRNNFDPAFEAGAAGAGRAAWRSDLIGRLHRPLRVCGMVANTGEPGGGPFWTAGPEASQSAQIVEASQVDAHDPEQQRILGAATHFNPVDLVCCPRDFRGRLYDLNEFVDHDAVFIAEKSHQGRPLRSLELPGLWNGAMAGWNTVFVEVPISTFNPVKTVNDLLSPAHRAGVSV